MAFINGTITRWECKICQAGCRPRLDKDMKNFSYHHPEDFPISTNGYPDICENSGKVFKEDEINLVNSPNIITGRPDCY